MGTSPTAVEMHPDLGVALIASYAAMYGGTTGVRLLELFNPLTAPAVWTQTTLASCANAIRVADDLVVADCQSGVQVLSFATGAVLYSPFARSPGATRIKKTPNPNYVLVTSSSNSWPYTNAKFLSFIML